MRLQKSPSHCVIVSYIVLYLNIDLQIAKRYFCSSKLHMFITLELMLGPVNYAGKSNFVLKEASRFV